MLTVSCIVRSDICASFISATTVATGVEVTLTLTLVNVNAACTVYLWHCGRLGNCSLDTAAAESYLRGVPVTDTAARTSISRSSRVFQCLVGALRSADVAAPYAGGGLHDRVLGHRKLSVEQH